MRSTRREPAFNIPVVIVGLIASMTLIHLYRMSIGAAGDAAILSRFAFVPGRFTLLLDPDAVANRLASWTASKDPELRRNVMLASYFLRDGRSVIYTPLTYALLHGSWTHLGLNSLWLLAFGTPVARRIGPVRFLGLMVVTALAGCLAHLICFPFGFTPVIGASAAVSGAMGASLRFIFRSDPRSIPQRPVPLRDVFRDRRALSFIAVWFVTNSLFGAGSMALGFSDAPVAWQAHIGGFLVGLLAFPAFDPPISLEQQGSPKEITAETADLSR